MRTGKTTVVPGCEVRARLIASSMWALAPSGRPPTEAPEIVTPGGISGGPGLVVVVPVVVVEPVVSIPAALTPPARRAASAPAAAQASSAQATSSERLTPGV